MFAWFFMAACAAVGWRSDEPASNPAVKASIEWNRMESNGRFRGERNAGTASDHQQHPADLT
jgi:hypothetical protein